MKKTLLISGFVVALTFTARAQDPIFTQQNYGLAFINPAYTGAFACARAEMGYRAQWPAFGPVYQTFNAAYDQHFRFGGVGFNYSHDKAWVINTDRFDFSYAYGFGIGKADDGKAKVMIQPGVQFSYYHKAIKWQWLTFSDQIDPRRGFVYNTTEVPNTSPRNCFDVSAGLLAYSKRITFGAAAYHLNEPNEGFVGTSKLPMRFVVHGSGILWNADANASGLSIIPSFVLMKQQNFEMLAMLVTAKYQSFSLGAGYRSEDALLFTAGYSRWDFTLGYSYDLTISELGNTGGAHEVHLAYCFMKDRWSDTRRNVQAFF